MRDSYGTIREALGKDAEVECQECYNVYDVIARIERGLMQIQGLIGSGRNWLIENNINEVPVAGSTLTV